VCEEPREGRGCVLARAEAQAEIPPFAILLVTPCVIDLSPFRPCNFYDARLVLSSG